MSEKDSYMDRLKRVQAKFDLFRWGGNFNPVNRSLWEHMEVPSKAVVNIFKNQAVAQVQDEYQPGKKEGLVLENIMFERQLKRDSDKRAWRIFKEMASVFEFYPSTFHFSRVLGWGGMGLAMKFDELDADGERVRSVAVKRGLSAKGNEDLELEELALNHYIGCEHIVQLIVREPKPKPAPPPKTFPEGSKKRTLDSDGDSGMDDPPDDPPPKKAKLETEGPQMMVMEYLENGDIAHLIYRLRRTKQSIPNRILWRFFLCLVRACIEMANPPVDKRKNKSIERELVHFDIDPRNVFIDSIEPTTEEHEVSPRLKIGDFGLASFIRKGAYSDYDTYEDFRSFGKPLFYSPEQFTAEWDPIPPDANDMPHATAGNYGPHTNLWQVALVMECLITKRFPASPPVASTRTLADGTVYVTYGAHLLDDPQWKDVDIGLRILLSVCMIHEPGKRPPLADVLATILREAEKEDPTLTDYDLLEWITLLLNEP